MSITGEEQKLSNGALEWLGLLLKDRTGHEFDLAQDENYISISLFGDNKKDKCVLVKKFSCFYTPSSNFGCAKWDAKAENFYYPIVRFLPAPAWEDHQKLVEKVNTNKYKINYDILGLTYWALTRLEEFEFESVDCFGRFPAKSSHAYKYNYLDRPIVDEWFCILEQILKKMWPDKKYKEKKFTVNLSHDVDTPSEYGFLPMKKLLRVLVGHVIKRKQIKLVKKTLLIWISSKRQLSPLDPFNTFDQIMNLSEKSGLKSSFFFMSGSTNPEKDGRYHLNDPAIEKLLISIKERGHEVGLHPSYDTFLKPKLILKEFKALKSHLKRIGFSQKAWGGRMHYLRWKNPITLKAWDSAGLAYDSTLGYAEFPGFRCGTCFDYTAYDISEGKTLKLKVRPLIVMDCSIISDSYMGLGTTKEGLMKVLEIKNRCRSVGGSFNLLWHNSSLNSKQLWNMYQQIVEY